jgi:hypothetical protein
MQDATATATVRATSAIGSDEAFYFSILLTACLRLGWTV